MSDDELDIKDSMVMNRTRRSNAGNRLKSLLENEELLEDDENGIFMEFEEDDDFEIKVDDEEQEEEENDEENSENETNKSKRNLEVDDENFSSESEDEQESDEDEEEGEKQLQKEQRAERRAKSSKHKKTAPLIKKVKITDDADEEIRRKKRERDAQRQANMSKQLLSNARRSSKRESSIKNKQQVIERLQESEARRAQYVAPVIKETRKITQQELLAEAEITEKKNLASLRFYVEQEELRKQRQRAAMLAKRAPMTKFIRWSSKTTIIPPRRIFGRQPIELVMAQFGSEKMVKTEEGQDGQEGGEEGRQVEGEEGKLDEQKEGDEQEKDTNEDKEIKENDLNESNENDDNDDKNEENDVDMTSEHEENDTTMNNSSIAELDKSEDEGKETEENEVVDGENDKETKESIEPEIDEDKNEKDEQKENTPIEDSKNDEIETTTSNEQNDENTAADVAIKQEDNEQSSTDVTIKQDTSSTTLVYGPSACRARNLVTLMGFTDGYELPSNRAKQILLGYQSMRSATPADRRLQCAISGQRAVYIDPQTKIPYSSLQSYKVINMVEQGKMAWNVSLGGVYTGLLGRDQRHATGVPKQFYE